MADLFPAFSGGGLVASLKVDVDAAGVIGDVLFGHPQLTYAAAMPLQDAPFTRAVFSHVACGMGYFTGLGLYNAGAAAATVTVRSYKADGELTGTRQLSLGAGLSDRATTGRSGARAGLRRPGGGLRDPGVDAAAGRSTAFWLVRPLDDVSRPANGVLRANPRLSVEEAG